MNCTAITAGNHSSSVKPGGVAENNASATNRIGSARKKCTMLASTATTGSTSAGKSTFLIRFPLASSALDDSVSAEVNHVHGSRPQKRNSA